MTPRLSAAARVAVGALLSALLVAGVVLAAPPARADSAPRDPSDPGTPATVTADGLPTVQINGVVWSQVVVGNTVYVAGEFTRARPAGSPAGSNETVRNNLLAYDIRTGELITSFAPSLNAQALAVAASPDGSRIYVGGDFTTADGQPRYRFATYSTATGALLGDFQPSFGAEVRAVAVAGSTVYVGGIDWGTAGGAARNYLASFSTVTGQVTSWAPTVDYQVSALAVVNGGSAVVVAGGISSLNGQFVAGIGEVDATTGQTLPFAASTLTGNYGPNSAFTGLSTDGDTVYASMYAYASGTNEGVLAIDPNGGQVRWVDDCYGDTYAVWASGTAAYVAGHPHYCGNLGGFQQNAPLDGAVNYYRAIAFSKATMGKITPTTGYAVDRRGQGAMVGQPAPELLNWFPTIDPGTYTGQTQGPWSVTGNSQYVVYGGEFPTVNGVAQQGLVRFAVPSIAPNKMGPADTGLAPTDVTSWAAGTARVTVQTTYDLDNADLIYKLYRSDKPGVPVAQTVAHSTFYDRPSVSLVDQSAPPGQAVTYYVTAADPAGNTVTGSTTSVTIATDTTMGTTPDAYSRAVVADSPTDYWRFGEASGTQVYDQAGNNDLTLAAGGALNQAGVLPQNKAVAFDGTSAGTSATQTAVPGPNVFSLEGWFSTTSTAGGKLIGFGDSTSGLSGNNDRQLTLDSSGRVHFAVYNDVGSEVQSAGSFNDGKWHYVAATLNGSGMTLYLDGKPAGTKAGVTYGYPYSGYWRIGGDRTWDSSGPYLAATVDEVAVYPVALSAARVAAHFTAATSGNTAPTASFTSSVTGLGVAVDASASADPDGTVASYAWDFGNGQTATGKTASYTYPTAGTYNVKLTVTDNAGATGTVTNPVTVSAPPAAGTALATDRFERSTNGGWGSADLGGSWTISGTASNATVTGGSGRLTAAAGATIGAALPIAARDVSLTADVSFDKAASGGGTWYTLGTRNTGSSRYDAQLWFAPDATAMVSLMRIDSGAETDLGDFALPGSYTPGSVLKVRFETVGAGTTTLRARAWASGTAEPTAWQVTATDTTVGLQGTGGLYTDLYTSKTATAAQTVRLDNLVATTPGAAPANTAPTASFTSTVTGLSAALDGSASSDPEGPVASWAWDFGDGQTGSGKTVSHTYAAAGTFSVKLTVTDSAGATGTVTKPVAVTGPTPPPTAGTLATDAFGREATGGWGSADVGGAWTIAGSTANAVVTGGSGRLTAAAGNTTAATLPISAADVSIAADMALDKVPTGGGSFVGLAGRNSGSTRYTAQLWVGSDLSAMLSLVRVVNGTESDLGDVALPGTYTAGSVIKVRFEITGSATTALKAKAWASGSAEPAAWQLTRSDSTAALQGAGGLRTELYTSARATSAQTMRMDNLSVTAPGAGTPNAAPTASFTSTVSGLVASVDASGSSDPEGPIASYAWEFGDGTTGAGRTASHTYAAAGTYSVKLTVTDSAGATGTVTKSVTVSGGTPPAGNTGPRADFVSSASGLTASVDGSASSSGEGPIQSWAWEFGDGQTGTGKTASHTYAAAGTYSVKLTVVDGTGASGTVTKSVTVSGGATPPPAGTLAMDAFGRTVSGGWGSADVGGAWTIVGTAANASVGTGAGSLTAAKGAGIYADLGASVRDVAVQADVSLTKAASGGGTYVNVAGRNMGGNQYNAQLWFASDGTVWLSVLKEANGVETGLGDFQLPGVYAVGTAVTVRLDVSGSGTTALHAKAWTTGTAEPTAWQLNATDGDASLQRAGGLEVQLYTSSSAAATQTVKVDNVWAGAAGTAPR